MLTTKEAIRKFYKENRMTPITVLIEGFNLTAKDTNDGIGLYLDNDNEAVLEFSGIKKKDLGEIKWLGILK